MFASATSANRVLGQLDFVHIGPNLIDAKGLSSPHAVAIANSGATGRVYIADAENNRVLGWANASSFGNGAPADLVIGQPDFSSNSCNPAADDTLCLPSGVAVDGSGNLYVSDSSHSRVLEYTNPFGACSSFPCVGDPADLVFGQGGMTSVGCNSDTGGGAPTNADLCQPSAIAVDKSDNLYVADSGNNRVLKYNTPLSTDTVADMVFGQGGSFTVGDCNFDTGGGNPTANDLCDPSGVVLDGAGNLYIADTINSRVLEYNAPLTTTANRVLGQGGSFGLGDCNSDTLDIGSSADDLCNPTGLGLDAAGDLYVADTNNSRVLEYTTPLTTNATADLVFGQGGDFTSDVCNFDVGVVNDVDGSTAIDLCTPTGVALDGSGDLYVADAGNNRTLEYNSPLGTNTTAAKVLGQMDFTHQRVNLTDGQGLSSPETVAIDSSATPNRIYATDPDNNRVLGWRDATSFANGAPADLVIGQPDFLSYFCDGADGKAVTASSLCQPEGIAVDGFGNLIVADSRNNRVLEFNSPFTACGSTFPCVGGPANIVVGQGASFTSNIQNNGGIGAASLAFPIAVATDGSGNLYVVDNNNNRVLEYNAPVTTGSSATLVFGQGGSFTSHACNFDTGGFLKGASAIDLCDPFGVATDAIGNLYVADYTNARVLEYNTPLNAGSGETGAGDTIADAVIGQGGSLTSNRCNKGGKSASSLCLPSGVALDGSGNLYVADSNNSRVLEYNSPLTTDTIADQVFGTCGSFGSSACSGISADSLNDPTGVALDRSGSLYVADHSDNRVLAYAPPPATTAATATATAMNCDRDRDSDCSGNRHGDGDNKSNSNGHCHRDRKRDLYCHRLRNHDFNGDRDCIAYCNGNFDRFCDRDRKRYPNCNGNCHAYCNRNFDIDRRDNHCDSNRNSERHIDSYGDRHSYDDSDSNSNSNSDRHTDSGAGVTKSVPHEFALPQRADRGHQHAAQGEAHSRIQYAELADPHRECGRDRTVQRRRGNQHLSRRDAAAGQA